MLIFECKHICIGDDCHFTHTRNTQREAKSYIITKKIKLQVIDKKKKKNCFSQHNPSHEL